MKELFNRFFEDKRILITGHTGFKGSWLTTLLTAQNASILGISLEHENDKQHFKLIKPECMSDFVDIRNYDALEKSILNFEPEIVFHLAAQSLVRKSYKCPIDTYSTNIIGTVNVYEACKSSKSVRVIVAASTDKVYENKNQLEAYAESDKLGGHDPYSASKACMEILSESHRKSFFHASKIRLATVRAGNVIGGGDWSEDRLIPDIFRAVTTGTNLEIRNPNFIRPWQHVLEPLYGYITLAKELFIGKDEFASAWNFGPKEQKVWTVQNVIDECKSHWPEVSYEITGNLEEPHEEEKILLNCEKSNKLLNWKPIWDTRESIARTINWYKKYSETGTVDTLSDIKDYLDQVSK